MSDEPDIIMQLRKEEKLGFLHSKTQCDSELKFVKQPPERDITEQKKAEDYLRESEKRYSDMLANLDEGFYSITLEGILLYHNRKINQILGFSPDENLVGKRVFDFWRNLDDRKLYLEKLEQNGSVRNYLVAARKQDGKPIFVELFGRLVKDKQGDPVRIDGSIVDVTERMQAQQLLCEREERYRLLFTEALDGICLADAETGLIIDCNQALADLVGRERVELIGQSQTILHPHDKNQDTFSSTFRQHLTSEEGHTLETQVVTRIGSIREVEIKANHLNLQGRKMLLGIFHDITERIKVENALRRSEEKYRLVTENASDAIWTMDMNLRFTYASPSHERMTGYTTEDVLKLSLDEFLTTESLERALRTFATEMERENSEEKDLSRSVILELDEIRVDGSIFPIETRISFLRDSKGNPIGILGITRDITERRQIEQSLRESEKRYRTILDQAADAVIMHDSTGRIMDVNLKACHSLGYSRDELLSMSIRDIDPEAIQIGKDKLWSKVIAGEQVLFESHHRRKDGRVFPVEVTLGSVSLSTGQGVIGIVRDITERKQVELLEHALYEIARASETAKNLHDLYRVVHLIIKSLMSAKNFYVCLYDEEENLLHYPYFVDEIDILPEPEQPGKGLTAYVLRTGQTLLCDASTDEDLIRRGEVELVGSPSACWLGAPLKVGEKIIGVIALQHYSDPKAYSEREKQILDFVSGQIAHTIEHKRSEEERQKMHEMLQKVNKDLEQTVMDRTAEIRSLLNQKDEFINQLGHDLKNPLTPLITLLPLLKKHVSDTESLERFDVVLRNVEYMKNLVTKTLELARLSSPNTVFDLEDINLTEKINETLHAQKLMFQTRHITVDNKIRDTIIIQADALRFEELLNNLLTNAVKYTPEGGGITLDAKPEKEWVIVSIHDTGIGLTEGQIAHIFDEFYKVDQSRHDFESSGLGLPICKRIAAKHGGKIWVESEGLGKGCTFYFTMKTRQKESRDK
ncbi:Methyl sulfide methyltransferase-associated sensor [uncultured archaeon]|nr:Methyl sulfide methyltransferase-associated sensor [uncultured archaeon]